MSLPASDHAEGGDWQSRTETNAQNLFKLLLLLFSVVICYEKKSNSSVPELFSPRLCQLQVTFSCRFLLIVINTAYFQNLMVSDKPSKSPVIAHYESSCSIPATTKLFSTYFFISSNFLLKKII